jgi:hypothetical protein
MSAESNNHREDEGDDISIEKPEDVVTNVDTEECRDAFREALEKVREESGSSNSGGWGGGQIRGKGRGFGC